MTPEQAIAALNELEINDKTGPYGPGDIHEAADNILMRYVDPEVASAYNRVQDRAGAWWYS